jgi:hypothetical protein
LFSSDSNSGSLTFNYSPDSNKLGKKNASNGSIANKSSKNSKGSNSKGSNSKNYSNSNTSSSKGGVSKKPIYKNDSDKTDKIRVTNIIVGGTGNAFGGLNNPQCPDMMLRDIKALHLITQKALSTNTKQNPLDSIDDERRSFMNFNNINSKKALFIDDPSAFGNDNDKHIINIININNNYNIENINCPSTKNSLRKSLNTINFYRKGTSGSDNQTPRDSAVSSRTNLKRMIPLNKSTSIKDIMKVYTKEQHNTQKFIKISK